MIIFDDLERISKEFELSSLLGYINHLFLSNIKVVVICNSKEIKYKKDEFNDFKEKVFDREYKLEKAPKDVIIEFFDNNELDNKVIENFNENIRLALKAALFFNEIKMNLINIQIIMNELRIKFYYGTAH